MPVCPTAGSNQIKTLITRCSTHLDTHVGHEPEACHSAKCWGYNSWTIVPSEVVFGHGSNSYSWLLPTFF